ncbi:thermonuclease family protein [Taklimakanibacter deserti]|uniref:thermonuclease family protein n=1 Tax=Taklimakanibacter deserti TaxID=2267839 RepID=UPI000E647358
MRAALIALALSVLASAAVPAQAMEVAGTARVVDGDTLEIGTQAIRIHSIDAPEASQVCQLPKGTWDCSGAAVNVLRAMTEGREVRCAGHEVDQYGRLIARCATDEVPDIGAQLVASGLAWAFIKYSTDYRALEAEPRAKKLGIWQAKTQPPWEYRARRWDTATKLATASEGCPIKGNINGKGERIYHAPWSKHYAKTRIDTAKGERWFCSEAEARARNATKPRCLSLRLMPARPTLRRQRKLLKQRQRKRRSGCRIEGHSHRSTCGRKSTPSEYFSTVIDQSGTKPETYRGAK